MRKIYPELKTITSDNSDLLIKLIRYSLQELQLMPNKKGKDTLSPAILFEKTH
jgi:hypothetical protein